MGVEGFVARRGRGEAEAAVELDDGRRKSVGVSGAVLVRWCLGGDGGEADDWRDEWCCCNPPPDDFRAWRRIAAGFKVRWHTRQGSARYRREDHAQRVMGAKRPAVLRRAVLCFACS